jgi:hypothetical protein
MALMRLRKRVAFERFLARPYAVLAREVGIAVDIESGHALAARLLDPVLRLEAGGHWDPEAQRWRSRT